MGYISEKILASVKGATSAMQHRNIATIQRIASDSYNCIASVIVQPRLSTSSTKNFIRTLLTTNREQIENSMIPYFAQIWNHCVLKHLATNHRVEVLVHVLT